MISCHSLRIVFFISFFIVTVATIQISPAIASGRAKSTKQEAAVDPAVTRSIGSLCNQLMGEREKRNFQFDKAGLKQADLQSLWADYTQLLDASSNRAFASTYESMAVRENIFRRTSWMMPNESSRFQANDFSPAAIWHIPPISFEDHLANLRLIRSRVQNPDAGMFGPQSLFWKVVGVAGDLLTFGAINHLQLAHPVGAQGVSDHSRLFAQPIERMRDTAKYIYQIIYNPWDDVQKIAIGLFKGHSRVTGLMPEDVSSYHAGETYHALSPEALLWVYATRFMAWVEAYNLLALSPLDDFEREQVYQESKLFALVFGIPLTALPRTFADFYKYYQFMIYSDRLTVGKTALTLQTKTRAMGDQSVTSLIGAEVVVGSFSSIAPTLLIYKALQRGYESMASFYMPKPLRQEYGFVFSDSENKLNAHITLQILHALNKRGLATLPAYEIANARILGTTVPAAVLQRHRLITGETR